MNTFNENIPSANLIPVLKKYQSEIGPTVAIDLNADNVTKLDFSASNPLLTLETLRDTEAFNNTVNRMLREKNADYGIGGYLEHRVIYKRSGLFQELSESRSMHLGIDVWGPAGTAIFAPLPGEVYGFHDNKGFGNYGPTIVLEHEQDDVVFYTLYGHLNLECLLDLTEGKVIAKGEKIAEFGPYPENGDWPPHLHFEVIADMQGLRSDFPGVCKPSEQAIYASLCPNPNLILKSRHLN